MLCVRCEKDKPKEAFKVEHGRRRRTCRACIGDREKEKRTTRGDAYYWKNKYEDVEAELINLKQLYAEQQLVIDRYQGLVAALTRNMPTVWEDEPAYKIPPLESLDMWLLHGRNLEE